MEFPELGKHCCESTCKQLDFLPMKCDACEQIFCKDHITYQSHNCEASYKKDVQVPVCPLCNKPVPVNRGEPPDIKVSEHIDRDCQSDPAKKKRKAYSNRCNVKGCKQKELIPVICDRCHLNFCLKHRHEVDHKCQGFQGSGKAVSRQGAAALRRADGSSSSSSKATNAVKQKPQQTTLTNYGRDLDRERRERALDRGRPRQQQPANQAYSLQAGMTEEEAMARALQMSISDTQPKQTPQTSTNKNMTLQEQEDLALAQALAASEEEQRRESQRRRRQQQHKESSCSVA
ncbi:AN1-type zinc finger protein 2A-like isoform X2 [Glandiceps talaboti]